MDSRQVQERGSVTVLSTKRIVGSRTGVGNVVNVETRVGLYSGVVKRGENITGGISRIGER